MNISKFLTLCLMFFVSITLSNGQNKFDATATLTVKEMAKLVKKDKSFAFDDFVQGSINHKSTSEYTKGLLRNQWVNFSANENVFYVKVDDTVYKLNPRAVVGVYDAGPGKTLFLKSNNANPTLFCETLIYQEDMFVYLMKGETFARIGDQDVTLPLTKEGIESTLNISSNTIDKYIATNKLDFNNKEDLKSILKQYYSAL